jgi:hypothetical protein
VSGSLEVREEDRAGDPLTPAMTTSSSSSSSASAFLLLIFIIIIIIQPF